VNISDKEDGSLPAVLRKMWAIHGGGSVNKERGYLSYEEAVAYPPQPLSATPPIDLTTLTLTDLAEINTGYNSIRYDEFSEIHSDIDLVIDRESLWREFDRNSLRYCIIYAVHGEALTKLALQKAQAKR
jgi:hypothetical protein